MLGTPNAGSFAKHGLSIYRGLWEGRKAMSKMIRVAQHKSCRISWHWLGTHAAGQCPVHACCVFGEVAFQCLANLPAMRIAGSCCFCFGQVHLVFITSITRQAGNMCALIPLLWDLFAPTHLPCLSFRVRQIHGSMFGRAAMCSSWHAMPAGHSTPKLVVALCMDSQSIVDL